MTGSSPRRPQMPWASAPAPCSPYRAACSPPSTWPRRRKTGTPLFVQISDTHIGFNKEANPDVVGTLNRSHRQVNALPRPPALALHTGDVTHLSKAGEFDMANQLLSRLKVSEMHVVPGEHDVTDGPGAEFFARFGKPSGNRGYYSFDPSGRAFRRPGQCDELQAQRSGRAGRGPAGLAEGRSGRPFRQPADRGLRPYAALDHL